jgi:hypothetical protein
MLIGCVLGIFLKPVIQSLERVRSKLGRLLLLGKKFSKGCFAFRKFCMFRVCTSYFLPGFEVFSHRYFLSNGKVFSACGWGSDA